jgi:hypothetical protein
VCRIKAGILDLNPIASFGAVTERAASVEVIRCSTLLNQQKKKKKRRKRA